MAYSSCRVNKGLNFFEKLMRASFQYFSNKLKRYSIKVYPYDPWNPWLRRSGEGVKINYYLNA